ncbi:MAG: 4'-phosphopantetheinyl transferase superfamily protein [Clostridia bacterium]|nr:4'-phosphopantetheinyl transferase superfamily protein [Clostridia bacterium]
MIKVFAADCGALENEELYMEYYKKMPSLRQESTDKFLQKRDRLLSVGAWALLMKALDGEDPGKVLFGENGKPYFENSGVFFNLSHSGNMAMCSVSESVIGCDIEMKKDVDMRVARRFFYRTEIELLESLQTYEEKKDTFFRLWTLKESFMKATGLGFKLALSDFCVYFENSVPKVFQNVDKREYFFKEYFINEKYASAVCSADVGELPEKVIVIDDLRSMISERNAF